MTTPDADGIGKAFLQYYYQLFETNRAQLGTLYQDASMLTFEGQKYQGAAAIVSKLSSLGFAQCKVAATSIDCQPSVSGGIIIFVTGNIVTEGEAHSQKFSQVFHLMSVGSSYVVTNDMFRLNYG